VRNINTFVPGVTIPYAYVTHITVGPDGDVYAVSSHNVPFLFAAVLVLDKDGNLYVPDTYNHRSQRFDRTGEFVSTRGFRGSTDPYASTIPVA